MSSWFKLFRNNHSVDEGVRGGDAVLLDGLANDDAIRAGVAGARQGALDSHLKARSEGLAQRLLSVRVKQLAILFYSK